MDKHELDILESGTEADAQAVIPQQYEDAFAELDAWAERGESLQDKHGAQIKRIVTSFNRRRPRLRADDFGITYIQGLPSRDIVVNLIQGGTISGTDLIENLAKLDRFHFKARMHRPADTYIARYHTMAERGLHGDDFLDQTFPALEPTERVQLVINKPAKKLKLEDKESYAGIMFVAGLKEYVAELRVSIEQIRSLGIEEESIIQAFFPPNKLESASNDLTRLAAMQGNALDADGNAMTLEEVIANQL